MKMNRYVNVAVLFLLLISGLSCSRRRGSTASSPWNGGLIKRYGTYTKEDGSISITVGKKPKTLLEYVVKGRNGEVLITSSDVPQISVVHRWRLYWDNTTENLWVCSSDIGDAVWVKADESGYKIHSVYDVPEIAKDIPDALLVTLSSRSQDWYRSLSAQEDSESSDGR